MIVHNREKVGPWKAATLLLALVAVGASGWALAQLTRIATLEEQADSARAELSLAKEALQQALKQDLPVSVSYGNSGPESGMVAVFKSDFPRPLEIVAMCSSPRTSQRKRFNLVIPARGSVEIGHADGWKFMPGQRILLSNTAFRPAEYVVPEP
jgi:hypothetical protein